MATIPYVYTLEFIKDKISLNLINESPDRLLYETTRIYYDLERNEKAKLTFILVLTQLTDEERKQREEIELNRINNERIS